MKALIFLVLFSFSFLYANDFNCTCDGYYVEAVNSPLVRDAGGGFSSIEDIPDLNKTPECYTNNFYRFYTYENYSTWREVEEWYVYGLTETVHTYMCETCDTPDDDVPSPPDSNSTHSWYFVGHQNCLEGSSPFVNANSEQKILNYSLNCCANKDYYQACPIGQKADTINSTCHVDPNSCPIGEHKDLNGACVPDASVCTPDEIYYNGSCITCSVGFVPNETKTTCICIPPTIYQNGICVDPQTTCPDPQQYYNPNTGNCDPHDCPPNQHPQNASEYSNTLICVPNNPDNPDSNTTDPNNPDNPDGSGSGTNDPNCDHKTELFGFPFSHITNNPYECDTTSMLFNCPDGDYACYKANDNPDSNTTDPNNPDNPDENSGNESNQTDPNNPDSNSSNNLFDTTNLEKKLSDIENSLGKNGQINKSLAEVGNSISGMNKNLGNKLDDIEKAIKDKNISLEIDLNETNDILRDINASLNPLVRSDDLKPYHDAEDNAKRIFDDALSSFASTGFDIRALSSGLTPPSISTSGDCTITRQLSFGSFTIDLSSVSILRPYVQFFLNLVLFIFSWKLYSAIARDIMTYFSSGW